MAEVFDWLGIGPEFGYALIAFIGSIVVLQMERFQDRLERRRERRIGEWTQYQEICIEAIEQFNRSHNHLYNSQWPEFSGAIAALSTAQNRYGFLMVVTQQKKLEKACMRALGVCEDYIKQCHPESDELDVEVFGGRFKLSLEIAVSEVIVLHMSPRRRVVRWYYIIRRRIGLELSDTLNAS